MHTFEALTLRASITVNATKHHWGVGLVWDATPQGQEQGVRNNGEIDEEGGEGAMRYGQDWQSKRRYKEKESREGA